jgi:cell division cycle 2-like protein
VELWTGKPLFRGSDDIQQLRAMFSCLGAPNEKNWPNLKNFKKYSSNTFVFAPKEPIYKCSLPYILQQTSMTTTSSSGGGGGGSSCNGLQMIESLLTYNPNKRPTAASLLFHSYFNDLPRPLAEYMMPTFSSTHQIIENIKRMPKNRGTKKEL